MKRCMATLAVTLVFVACGKPSSPQQVSVPGVIEVLDYTNSIDTSGLGGPPFDPCDGVSTRVAGVTLTFRDQSNKVVSVATTGTQTITPKVHPDVGGTPSPVSYCDLSAPFTANLPRATFYQVTVPGFGQQDPVPYSDVVCTGCRFVIVLSVGA